MRDAAIAMRSEIEHLVFERICGERPAMTENHRLPGAPVLVVNLRTVFGCEGTHGSVSFRWVGMGRGVGLLGSCNHRRCRQACGNGNTSAADQKPAARWGSDHWGRNADGVDRGIHDQALTLEEASQRRSDGSPRGYGR